MTADADPLFSFLAVLNEVLLRFKEMSTLDINQKLNVALKHAAEEKTNRGIRL